MTPEQIKPASPLVLDRFDQLSHGIRSVDAAQRVMAQMGGTFIYETCDELGPKTTLVDQTVVTAMKGGIRGITRELEQEGFGMEAYRVIYTTTKSLSKK